MPLGSVYTPDAAGKLERVIYIDWRTLTNGQTQHATSVARDALHYAPKQGREPHPQENKAHNARMTPENVWKKNKNHPRATEQHGIAKATHIC
jgi:hypothetical protein